MKQYLTFTLLILISLNIYAQNKQYAIWYFARNGLNFNYSPAIAVSNPATINNGDNAVLCDENGVLIYRYNNNNIYDINNQVIENGTFNNDYNVSQFHQFLNLGEETYFFHLDSFSLKYSTIDNLANSGNGAVLTNQKSISLFDWTNQGMRGFYIIRSDTCNKFWLILRLSEIIQFFTLDESGEIKYSHESAALFKIDTINIYQTLKFSKSGNMYAIAEQSKIETGYFNRTTGAFELRSVYSMAGNPLAYEFSADNRFFYYIDRNKLYQVPIIDFVVDWQNKILIKTLVKTGGYDAQLGIDDKIYFIYISGNLISVIQNPNEQGVACDFQENAITLLYTQMTSRFPRYPILQSTCSEYSILIDNYCEDTLTQFSISSTSNIQSVLWNFGDSQTSTELNPSHVYANAGIYTITLDVTFTDNSTQTITKTIGIVDKPMQITIEHE